MRDIQDRLDELKELGLIAQSTDEVQLATALAAGPVTFYGGFDPIEPARRLDTTMATNGPTAQPREASA